MGEGSESSGVGEKLGIPYTEVGKDLRSESGLDSSGLWVALIKSRRLSSTLMYMGVMAG